VVSEVLSQMISKVLEYLSLKQPLSWVSTAATRCNLTREQLSVLNISDHDVYQTVIICIAMES